jgi:hypothetical protein
LRWIPGPDHRRARRALPPCDDEDDHLITAAVAEHAGQAGSLSAESREQTLLIRIHAFIDQHLGDSDLAPGPVAAAHYISVRYLYRLFESQGTAPDWRRGPRRGTRPSPGWPYGNRRTTSTTPRPGCRMTSRPGWTTWSARAGGRRR